MTRIIQVHEKNKKNVFEDDVYVFLFFYSHQTAGRLAAGRQLVRRAVDDGRRGEDQPRAHRTERLVQHANVVASVRERRRHGAAHQETGHHQLRDEQRDRRAQPTGPGSERRAASGHRGRRAHRSGRVRSGARQNRGGAVRALSFPPATSYRTTRHVVSLPPSTLLVTRALINYAITVRVRGKPLKQYCNTILYYIRVFTRVRDDAFARFSRFHFSNERTNAKTRTRPNRFRP